MGVTFRSVVIGLLLIPLNCMWLALAEVVWYSGEPTTLSLYPNVVFLICVVAVVNGVVKKLRPAWGLTPCELLVIYVMLSVGSSLSGHDMLWILLPTLSHLHRYGPIEGRYGDIIEKVPTWLVVRDPVALDSAYVGQESIFRAQNFVPWLEPLAWWFAFVMALCAVMWGINLLFRKQWTEHEKLAYPIIQVPMLVANEAQSLLRSRAFWAAFGLTAFIDIVNGLHVLYPLSPRIPIVQVLNLQTLFRERPWNDMGGAWISFYPCIIGLCFFMPLDLAFSSWFFFLMWKLQRVLASSFGMLGVFGFPHTYEQAAGGFYAVALMALWITRNHLRRTAAILIGRSSEETTRWERREVWLASWLMIAGGAFLFYFCYRAQMTPTVIVLFFIIYFTISVAITRMRAELGPPSHDIFPVGAHRQVVAMLGAVEMRKANPHDLVMFGFLNFFNRVCRTHPMPHGLEGFRIAERMKMDHFRMFLAMWVAIVAGTIGAFFAMLWAFDKYGIAARMSRLPELFGRETWDTVNIWLTTPTRRRAGPTYAILIGTVFSLGLAMLRLNLTWWPLHPVGFATSAGYTMERIWFCVLIAWTIKAIVLKYGGAKAYKPALRFFAGLVIGDFVFGSFWYTYGIVMETKVYHFWPY